MAASHIQCGCAVPHRLTHALSVAAALALMCLLFPLAPSAWADDAKSGDENYSVLVLPYASIHRMLPAQVGEKTTQFLKTEIRGTDGVKLVSLKRKSSVAVSNPTPPIDQSKLNRAKQNIAEAKAAADAGEFTAAIANYHKAIAIERDQHPYIDFDELRNQYIMLAVMSFQLGEESVGQRYLETAVRLDTAKSIDAKLMPPVFVHAFKQALKRIADQPTASLEVKSSVENAEVYLNGKKIGATPLSKSDLPPGTHYLKVVPPEGSTIWAQSIELVSAQVTRINARIDLIGGALEDINRELSDNQLTPNAANRVVELAREAGASHVIVGGVHQTKDGIAMSSFLIAVKARTVCPLEGALFDEAMMGAGIELYKVGSDIMRKLKTCETPIMLPTQVAADAQPRSTQSDWVFPKALAAYQAYVHSPSASHTLGGEGEMPPPRPRRDDSPRAAQLQAPLESSVLDDEPGGREPWSERDGQKAVKEEKRSLTWLWITLGVVAAAGLATGGYFIYDAAAHPQPTGSASWSM